MLKSTSQVFENDLAIAVCVWFIEIIWSYHKEDALNIHYLAPEYRIFLPEKLLFLRIFEISSSLFSLLLGERCVYG